MYKAELTPSRYFSIEWCTEHFGREGIIDYHANIDIVAGLRWWRRDGHVFFRNEQDYMFYCLRWS
jgi:hypothetical protein